MMEENRMMAENHVRVCAERFSELKAHLRQDISGIDEPQCRAMFETAAEVLGGLEKAFRDYRAGKEQAFQTR